MKAKLVAVRTGAVPAEIPLQLPTVIGRGRRAGVAIPHSLISRQHCELYEAEERLMVRDLGSTNGTVVNRRKITEATPLQHGDLLILGPLAFQVHVIDACATCSDTGDETAIAHATVPESTDLAGNRTVYAPHHADSSPAAAPNAPLPAADPFPRHILRTEAAEDAGCDRCRRL